MARLPYTKPELSGKFPIIKLVQKDPSLAAAVSKAVKGERELPRDRKGRRSTAYTPQNAQQISQKRARRNTDNSVTLNILPDIRLCGEILVSSILSPKDLSSFELIYGAPDELFPSELRGVLLNKLKELLEKTYDLKTIIPTSLYESLFEKGSYPTLVVPENAIDAMINKNRTLSLESIREFFDTDTGEVIHLGILANPKKTESEKKGIAAALESFKEVAKQETYNSDLSSTFIGPGYFKVIDNPAVLRSSGVVSILSQVAIERLYQKNGYTTSMESMDGITDFMIDKAIMRNRRADASISDEIPNQFEINRKSVGQPLVMKLPTESVIPVYVPGDPEKHVGYYILLDDTGNPIRITEKNNSFSYGANQTSNIGNAITTHIGREIFGGDTFDPNNALHQQIAFDNFAKAVEDDLIARIRNSGMVTNVSIGQNTEIYRLMLSRALQSQRTQLLYVPKEYMSYIAFDYTDDGVGESLLDKQSQLNVLRITLLFADVLNSVRNSIGRTKVTVKLDEEDNNPEQSIQIVQEEVIRSRALTLPTGISDPSDITKFIQAAAYEWDIQNQPGLPDMMIEFNQTTSNYPKVDAELTKMLRDQSIKAFNLTPEMVDTGGEDIELATSLVNNNILLAKRVIVLQDKYTPQASEFIRMLARNDSNIIEQLKDIISKNIDKLLIKIEDLVENKDNLKNIDKEHADRIIVSYCLKTLLDTFYVTLPRPTSITTSSQKAELDDYVSLIDTALDAYFDGTMLNKATVGDLEANVGTLKAMYKSHFIREYLAEKGIASELSEMVSNTDETGGDEMNKEILKQITDYILRLSRSSVKALALLAKNSQAVSGDIATKQIQDGAGGESSSFSSGSSSGPSDDFGLDGFGDMSGLGGDDLGLDDTGPGIDLASETPSENQNNNNDTPTE